jgi:hypothetical protein
MASRQVFRLMNNSFVLSETNIIERGDLKIFHVTFDDPIVYTITCIAIIVTVAFISEKALQTIADKKCDNAHKNFEK